MASIVAALDKHVHIQKGENGHAEYGWAKSTIQGQLYKQNPEAVRDNKFKSIELLKEQIVQFYFQLTRTDSNTLQNLSDNLLSILQNKYINTSVSHIGYQATTPNKGMCKDEASNTTYLSLLYQLIGQTRDIINGKGEYNLAYMQIYTWYKVYPELAKKALETFVFLDKPNMPYGSWKDIKYFCEYCKTQCGGEYHDLIHHAIRLVNRKLWTDSTEWSAQHISLVAKWIPREGSKYSWLFERLVKDYFAPYYDKAKTPEAQNRAHRKAKMNYRKIIASINRRLDTVQIKQCANAWDSIDHSKTTSNTIVKQRKAFLNLTSCGKQRSIKDDRVKCAEQFRDHIRTSIISGKEIKGANVSMPDFVKQTLGLLQHTHVDSAEFDTINSQWRSNGKHSSLKNAIALVDVSSSMHGDPLYAAIALGIRIAESSTLGKRILTFESNPRWVDLTDQTTFTEMVERVSRAPWRGSTDLYKAFELILNAIVHRRTPPEEVANMMFVVLSDMQIDECQPYYYESFDTMVPKIQQLYANAGIMAVGKPYTVPHLVFWNLRSTNGFPSLSSTPNVSMVSGFSPKLLANFAEKGIEALAEITPWNQFMDTMRVPRYQPLANIIRTYFPVM